MECDHGPILLLMYQRKNGPGKLPQLYSHVVNMKHVNNIYGCICSEISHPCSLTHFSFLSPIILILSI